MPRPEPPASPRQAHLDALFAAEAPFWRDLYAGQDVLAWIHRYRTALCLAWIDGLDPADSGPVLEIGCGAGLMAVELARRELRVEATDVLEAMLDLAGRTADEAGQAARIRFTAADVHDLPFADGRFRLAVALGVMPWIDRPQVALAEMARVVAPGGRLILSVNNPRPLHAVADPVRLPLLSPLRDRGRRALATATGRTGTPRARPIEFARPPELARRLEVLGLRVVRSQGFGFGPFTVLGRRVLAPGPGVALERRLQRRAERGDQFLAAAASQYLVLAEKPPG